MFNTYTEDFKRNAVAVVRSGYRISTLAKRLDIPPSSIRNWLEHPRYADVKPAGEDLLAKVPSEDKSNTSELVLIGEKTTLLSRNRLPELKITIGNAVIEVPKNTSADSFKILIQSLRDVHVL